MRAADGAVWAVSGDDGRVAKIDPATGDVVARNRIHGYAADLAVGGGFAWLAVVPDDVIFKLSADDLAVAGTTPARPGPDVLSWDSGQLWASTGVGRSLLRLGGDGGSTQLRMDAIPAGVAASGGLLWTATLHCRHPRGRPARAASCGSRCSRTSVGIDPATWLSPDVAQLRYATCAGLLAYPDAPGAERAPARARRSPPRRRQCRPTAGPTGSGSATGTASRRRPARAADGRDVPRLARAHAVAAARQGVDRDVGDRRHRRRRRLPRWPRAPRARPGGRRRPADHPPRAPRRRPARAPRACRCSARCRSARRRPQAAARSRCRRPAPTTSARRLPGAPCSSATRTTPATARADPTASSTSPASAPTRHSSASTRARSTTSRTTTTARGRSPVAAGATGRSARTAPRRATAISASSPDAAPGLDMLALNPRRPLFRDVAMRRAVNEALDRPALAAVWGELPTDRYVPPSILPG